MKSAEFCEVYDREEEIKPHNYDPQLVEYISPANVWAAKFSNLLHDRLANPQNIDVKQSYDMLSEYIDWLEGPFVPLHDTLTKNTTPEGLWANRTINFHRLNNLMLSNWEPIINGEWDKTPQERKISFTEIQNALALQGLNYYSQRANFASEALKFEYFSPSLAKIRDTFEGILTEFDAGIVLLECLKKWPNSNIVPAPHQFEHSSNGRYNVDFIVNKDQDNTIGIQVKTNVKKEHIKTYDSKRVVLIDGNIDLGNQISRRTNSKKSDSTLVNWAGIICAQRYKDIPSHGPAAARMLKTHGGPRSIVINKMLALELTRGIKPNLQLAASRISERILAQLNINDDTSEAVSSS